MRKIRKAAQKGFSTTELVIVVAIILVVGAIAVPNMMQIWYNMELRATGDEVAGLMQQGRILAAKSNSYYAVCYQMNSGIQQVYLSKFTLPTSTPCVFTTGNTLTVDLARLITAASAAPGGSPNPSNYVYSLDTTSGTPCDNTCTIAFTPRGLPCNYVSNATTCSTPTATYFVYYFKDSRPNGWGALLVTKAGRTKSLTWNGTSWN